MAKKGYLLNSKFSVGFFDPAIILIKHFGLISALTRREVLARYTGTYLGILWSVVTPAFLLIAYSFVFNVIFKARWAGADGDDSTFVLMLYAGMLVHGLVAECLARSPGLITATPSYVKKIVFPLEIVPLVCVAVALFNLCTGVGLLLIAKIAITQSLSWTNLLVVPVLLPMILVTLGISYFFSALGVYLRDLSQLTASLAMILLFFSPVFYPVSSVPAKYRVFFEWSPLTSTIENVRKVFLLNQTPDFSALGISFLASMLLCWAGYFTFQRMRKGFADVL